MQITMLEGSLRASEGPPDRKAQRMYVNTSEFGRLRKMAGCTSARDWLQFEWPLGHGLEPETVFVCTYRHAKATGQNFADLL